MRSLGLGKGKGKVARGNIRTTSHHTLCRGKVRRGGRPGWEAVSGEFKGQMEVPEGVLHGSLELGCLIQVHRSSPVRSPHAIEEADQVAED